MDYLLVSSYDLPSLSESANHATEQKGFTSSQDDHWSKKEVQYNVDKSSDRVAQLLMFSLVLFIALINTEDKTR